MKQTKFLKQKRFKSYTYLGSHLKDQLCRFRVWAPQAQSISLVGDFNEWDLAANPMTPLADGIWESFTEELKAGDLYKYAITQIDGNLAYKADPYAFFSEIKPKTASAYWPLDDYQWKDQKYCQDRLQKNVLESPMNIYEIHPASWKRNDAGDYLSYRELADTLIPYLLDMHYTHIELMGIMENGYYAVTSRYGSPEDFMYFIDSCHQKGLSVILDWDPSQFCKDAHGLCQFDGSHQYESGGHEQRKKTFDYSKPEVLDFLVSNAYFWFDVFHIDGLRVSGVASMVDSDDHLAASAFLQELNTLIFKAFPFAIMVAVDSSAHPLVTWPTHKDGLAFNLKWDLEWMHNSLDYLGTDPYFRHQFHHLLTFPTSYALNENFILPLPHHEVLPGKKSILGKLFGDYEEKFDQFRLLYGYMMTHPGKKLSFMGNEFAPFTEWQIDESLEWFMLQFEKHQGIHHYIKDLNKFYLREKALWSRDYDSEGFKWLEADNKEETLLIFSRMSDDPEEHLIIVINFLPMAYDEYPIGAPLEGTYRLAFNSDEHQYGGSGQKVKKTMKTRTDSHHGQSQSIRVNIPASSIMIFKKIKRRKRRK